MGKCGDNIDCGGFIVLNKFPQFWVYYTLDRRLQMKDALVLHPWFYVKDELLLAVYHKAIEQQFAANISEILYAKQNDMKKAKTCTLRYLAFLLIIFLRVLVN